MDRRTESERKGVGVSGCVCVGGREREDENGNLAEEAGRHLDG